MKGRLRAAARKKARKQAKLDFDIKRMVRSHTSYDLFPHHLGHDPMERKLDRQAATYWLPKEAKGDRTRLEKYF